MVARFDQEAAFECFLEMFRDDRSITESVDAENLPPSVQVAGDIEAVAGLTSAAESESVVYLVVDRRERWDHLAAVLVASAVDEDPTSS